MMVKNDLAGNQAKGDVLFFSTHISLSVLEVLLTFVFVTAPFSKINSYRSSFGLGLFLTCGLEKG
jgi:hypothetical protein